MNSLPHIRLRNLYNKFLYMDEHAFYDKIRFFEQHEHDIFLMKLEDSIWIQTGYMNALFAVGYYQRYIDCCEKFIHRLINHNIVEFKGENIFEECIYKSGVSHYLVKDFTQAKHVVKELLKINSSRKDARRVLYLIHKSEYFHILKFVKALLILMILVGSFLLIFEQVVVLSFFPEYSEDFLRLINYSCTPIFVLLFGIYIFVDIKARIKTRKWVQYCRNRKAINEK